MINRKYHIFLFQVNMILHSWLSFEKFVNILENNKTILLILINFVLGIYNLQWYDKSSNNYYFIWIYKKFTGKREFLHKTSWRHKRSKMNNQTLNFSPNDYVDIFMHGVIFKILCRFHIIFLPKITMWIVIILFIHTK